MRNARKEVTNHCVQLVDSSKKLVERVVELAHAYYKSVPVLVITSSQKQLGLIHDALRAAGELPPDEVQRLSEFDEEGKSLKDRARRALIMM